MRDLVETALGAIVVACLCLAVLLLPSALIDVVAGTNLLGPAVVALLAALLAAAILGIVASQQGRHSDDKSGRRPPDKTAEKSGAADRDEKKDWRRR